MPHALPHPASLPVLWLPPARMRQYAIARIVGGLLFAAIFAGWMVIQWSNVTMRFASAALIVLTAWVTVSSILSDARRMRGRQVEWDGDAMLVTTPDSFKRVRLAEITHATWRETTADYGLTFYDQYNTPLARLDENIIADEAEARTFLRWLRNQTETKFEVRWK